MSQLKQLAAARNDVELSALLQLPVADLEDLINGNGRMWICEIDNKMVGVAVVNLEEKKIPLVFVHPQFEKLGIGTQLNNLMVKLYFKKTREIKLTHTGSAMS